MLPYKQGDASARADADEAAQVPESGKIYSFNEGNYGSWAPHLQQYMDSLKVADKWDGKPYSARCGPQPCSVQTGAASATGRGGTPPQRSADDGTDQR